MRRAGRTAPGRGGGSANVVFWGRGPRPRRAPRRSARGCGARTIPSGPSSQVSWPSVKDARASAAPPDQLTTVVRWRASAPTGTSASSTHSPTRFGPIRVRSDARLGRMEQPRNRSVCLDQLGRDLWLLQHGNGERSDADGAGADSTIWTLPGVSGAGAAPPRDRRSGGSRRRHPGRSPGTPPCRARLASFGRPSGSAAASIPADRLATCSRAGRPAVPTSVWGCRSSVRQRRRRRRRRSWLRHTLVRTLIVARPVVLAGIYRDAHAPS